MCLPHTETGQRVDWIGQYEHGYNPHTQSTGYRSYYSIHGDGFCHRLQFSCPGCFPEDLQSWYKISGFGDVHGRLIRKVDRLFQSEYSTNRYKIPADQCPHMLPAPSSYSETCALLPGSCKWQDAHRRNYHMQCCVAEVVSSIGVGSRNQPLLQDHMPVSGGKLT